MAKPSSKEKGWKKVEAAWDNMNEGGGGFNGVPSDAQLKQSFDMQMKLAPNAMALTPEQQAGLEAGTFAPPSVKALPVQGGQQNPFQALGGGEKSVDWAALLGGLGGL